MFDYDKIILFIESFLLFSNYLNFRKKNNEVNIFINPFMSNRFCSLLLQF